MSDVIRVAIEISDKAGKPLTDFVKKSEQADKAFKKMGSSGSGAFNEIAVSIGKSLGVWEIFQGNLAANIAGRAFDAVASSAGALFNTLIVDGTKAAQESEDALNSLAVALAQNGNYNEKAIDSFQQFAQEIQKTTKFEDDAVIKNAALLASLTRLDNEGLKRATSAAIELSAALGKDLETTTEAIAKAANGNTTALKKMGISFDEAGTKAGTFNNALAAIESKFGGSAASKLNTFSGAVGQAKNIFGDLQEEFGNLIIKNPAVIAAINKVSEIMGVLKTSIEGNNQVFSKLVGEGFVSIIKGTAVVVEGFDLLVRGVKIAFGIIVELAEGTVALVAKPLSLISDEFAKVFDEASTNAIAAKDMVEENLAGGGGLSTVAEKLAEIAVAAEGGLGKIGTEAQKAGPTVKNLVRDTTELTEAQKNQRNELNEYVKDLAKKNNSVKEGYDNELSLLKSFYEQKESEDSKLDETNYERKRQREAEFFDQQQELLDQRYEAEIARIGQSTLDEETKRQATLQATSQYLSDDEKLHADHAKKLKQIKDQEYQGRVDTLNALTGLMRSKNREMFEIGKAASIVQIGINAYEGAVKAYNSLASIPYVGPALGSAAATALLAFGAEQAANVSSTNLSYESGGIIPGASFTGDRLQANVNSGEMVLNRQQQTELFDIARGRGTATGGVSREEVSQMISAAFSQPIIVQVDGKELINITRSQLASGRSLS